MIGQAETLVRLYEASGIKCATAESCTGGMVGSMITRVSGSSAVYLGGVVSYSNSVKEGVLKVSKTTLERYGAVSEECAVEMAKGVKALTGADVAVSVTGIAGPNGGSADKPVGLVCFAVSTCRGTRSEKVIFAGDREAVRNQASIHALGMLTVAAV